MRPTISDQLAPGTTALLVVQAASVVPALRARLVALLEAARRAQLLILFVDGRSGFEDKWITHDQDAPNEIRVFLNGMSLFLETPADLIFRANEIRSVVIGGVGSALLFEAIEQDVQFRGYAVFEAEDCVHRVDLEDVEPVSADCGAWTSLSSSNITPAWAKEASAQRGWQPDAKASRVLKTLERRVAQDHTALLLIGFQNDLCDAAGKFARAGLGMRMIDSAVLKAGALLATARRSGVRVIHVKSMFGGVFDGPLDARLSSACLDQNWICQTGTWGAEIVVSCAPTPDETIIEKHRHSAFADTSLDFLLRQLRVRTLVVGGVMTASDIESTVRDAAMRDYYTIVAEDAVAVPEEFVSEGVFSLETMSIYFAQVRLVDELLFAWEGAAPPRASIMANADPNA